jgi:hypothetical protein
MKTAIPSFARQRGLTQMAAASRPTPQIAAATLRAAAQGKSNHIAPITHATPSASTNPTSALNKWDKIRIGDFFMGRPRSNPIQSRLQAI